MDKRKLFNLILILLGIFIFVCSLSGLKESWVIAFAAGGEENMVRAVLQDVVRNPVTALFAGILTTALLQSSSGTIAIAIATVAAGGLTVGQAVPLVMGANIGTTITNTIVSLAHAFRRKEFVHVVPASLIDDIFKILNVAIFFTLELLTGFLSKSALFLTNFFGGLPLLGKTLQNFPDFLDIFTKPVLDPVIGLAITFFGKTTIAAVVLGIVSFAALAYGLKIMSSAIRELVKKETDHLIKKAFRTRKRTTLTGFSLCWILQSSSVTTSLAIPFVAVKMINLKQMYHYALGASLGTTCDAGQIISYIKFGLLGLSVGLVHVLLNFFGIIIFSFVPVLKDLPVTIAQKIGNYITKSKFAAIKLIVFTALIFYLIPLIIILFWR